MDLCAQWLKAKPESKNLKFRSGTDDDGDSVIEFLYEGKVAKMFFFGNEGRYLSVYEVFERVPNEKTVDVIFACNDLNVQYKWITFYVDKDNDVVLHLDAILEPSTAADETFELLLRLLKMGDDAKPTIMKAIYA